MPEITLQRMTKKELRALAGCSAHELRKMLIATKQAHAQVFENYNPKSRGQFKFSKTQVKTFLQHNDLLPENITL